jgi:hypothetical protein
MLYRLNNNLSGMNSDSDLQISIANASHSILHRQRCETTTNSMILMRLWGPKQCHDPVAL